MRWLAWQCWLPLVGPVPVPSIKEISYELWVLNGSNICSIRASNSSWLPLHSVFGCRIQLLLSCCWEAFPDIGLTAQLTPEEGMKCRVSASLLEKPGTPVAVSKQGLHFVPGDCSSCENFSFPRLPHNGRRRHARQSSGLACLLARRRNAATRSWLMAYGTVCDRQQHTYRTSREKARRTWSLSFTFSQNKNTVSLAVKKFPKPNPIHKFTVSIHPNPIYQSCVSSLLLLVTTWMIIDWDWFLFYNWRTKWEILYSC